MDLSNDKYDSSVYVEKVLNVQWLNVGGGGESETPRRVFTGNSSSTQKKYVLCKVVRNIRKELESHERSKRVFYSLLS